MAQNIPTTARMTEVSALSESTIDMSDPTFFRKLFNNLEDPVFVKNDQHQWVYTNDAFEQLVGCGDLVGKTDSDLLPADQVGRFYDGDNYVINNQRSLTQEERIGEDCYALVKKMPIKLADNSNGLVGVIFDISEYKKAQDEIINLRLAKQQSLSDPLTNIANRRHLEQFYSELLEANTADNVTRNTIGILHIDLDHFKEINDTLGHSVGDGVLVHVADVLRNALQGSDFVARIGGDEFVIITKSGNHSYVEQITNNIITEVSKPVTIEEQTVTLGVSIGAALDSSNKSLNQNLKFADIALYRAKKTGRGRTAFFSDTLNQEYENNRLNRKSFQLGIEQGHFFPVYQLQFDTATLEITGMEALARWNHPTRGLLPPSEFLDLAESEGCLEALDKQILQKAVADIALLRDQGMEVPSFSVNVSPQSIASEDFIDRINELTLYTGGICFELVESMLLDEPSGVVANNLAALHELGVSLDIDDFGSGHASLLGLLAAQPDRIKIDRRLVIPITESKKHRDIVKSIIQIADSLELETIAEGVESDAHREILQNLGCKAIQGFGFARPVPLEDLWELLLSRAA